MRTIDLQRLFCLLFFLIIYLFNAIVIAKTVKTIGAIIIESGDEDGVWLEEKKRATIDKRLGFKHEIISGGHLGEPYADAKVTVRPEISHKDPTAAFIFKKTVEKPYLYFKRTGKKPGDVGKKENQKMKELIESESQRIYMILKDWIKKEKIDLIVPQNSSTIPVHIPLGVAIKRLIDDASSTAYQLEIS